jgi:hypothetical protein
LTLGIRACSRVDFDTEITIDSMAGLGPGWVEKELVPYVFGLLSQVSPLVDACGGSVEFEVVAGDGAELGCVGDVAADLPPSAFVARVTVEVVFYPVGGVAPHRPSGKTGWNLTEQLDLPGWRSVEVGEDPFRPGPFEAGSDEGEIAHELGVLRRGGVDRPTTFVLVGVERLESGNGVGLGMAGSVEPLLHVVEVVGGDADGGGVASGPTLSSELIVAGDGVGHRSLGRSSLVDRDAEPGARLTPFGVSVGGQEGVEVGELSGEAVVGETQGFDTEGERVVAPTGRQGDCRPVRLECGCRGVEGEASPSFGPFEVVVVVLVVFESRHPVFGPGHDTASVDHGLLSGAEAVLEVVAFGPPGAAQAPQQSEAVEVGTGLSEVSFSGDESSVSDRHGAAGVGELGHPVGWLPVQNGPVTGDGGAEPPVGRPRVVDGGHGRVRHQGQGGGDLVVGVALVGEPAAIVAVVDEGGVPGVGGWRERDWPV